MRSIMGTDIHLAVEVRVKGVGWSYRPSFPKYDEEGFSWEADPCERFYKLFALLADVRNGFGFAGVSTHARIEPLFSGRGIPTDSVIDIDAHLGDHSFTWASFNELKAIDWDGQMVVQIGVVRAAIAKGMKDGVRPEGYIGAVTGPRVKMFRCVAEWEASGHPEGDSYVQVIWHDSPFEKCAFRTWVSGCLTQIAEEFGPENVRVLIGFDS